MSPADFLVVRCTIAALERIPRSTWVAVLLATGGAGGPDDLDLTHALVAATPGGLHLPEGSSAWASVLYMALVAGAVAI